MLTVTYQTRAGSIVGQQLARHSLGYYTRLEHHLHNYHQKALSVEVLNIERHILHQRRRHRRHRYNYLMRRLEEIMPD